MPYFEYNELSHKTSGVINLTKSSCFTIHERDDKYSTEYIFIKLIISTSTC